MLYRLLITTKPRECRYWYTLVPFRDTNIISCWPIYHCILEPTHRATFHGFNRKLYRELYCATNSNLCVLLVFTDVESAVDQCTAVASRLPCHHQNNTLNGAIDSNHTLNGVPRHLLHRNVLAHPLHRKRSMERSTAVWHDSVLIFHGAFQQPYG